MTEEERIHRGILFSPADPELKAIKLESHKLSALYSRTFEDETEERVRLLERLLGSMGEGGFMQGPIFFHYGKHTEIGKHFFANYNLTVQDDAKVAIGDHVSFGPNVTIVTPVHPFVASERRTMLDRYGGGKKVAVLRQTGDDRKRRLGIGGRDDLRRSHDRRRLRHRRGQRGHAGHPGEFAGRRFALQGYPADHGSGQHAR